MNHSILSRLGAAPLALALAFALLVGAVILTVGSAEAAPPKEFTMTISPTTIVAGEPTDVSFTLHNAQGKQPIQLGSANITIPDTDTDTESFFTVVAPVDLLPNGDDPSAEVAGNTIELRNLDVAKGTTWTGTFSVTADADACSDEPYVWEVEAKHANDFSGVGNSFAYVGSFPEMTVTCPEGDPDPPDPETFTCTGSGECSLSQSYLTTSVTLTAARNSTLFLELSRADDKPMACGEDNGLGFDKSAAILFDVRGNQISKIIEITLSDVYDDGQIPDGFRDHFKVCFGADKRFEGSEFDEGHSKFWVGILNMCNDDSPGGRPFPGAKQGKPTPCVVSIEAGEEDNTVVIVVWSPPGDPLIKIG